MDTNPDPRDRRQRVDRRSGEDSRSPEQKQMQGERRQGDRRARPAPGAARRNVVYFMTLAVALCFTDIYYYGGEHSTQLVVAASGEAVSLAHNWVASGFAR